MSVAIDIDVKTQRGPVVAPYRPTPCAWTVRTPGHSLGVLLALGAKVYADRERPRGRRNER